MKKQTLIRLITALLTGSAALSPAGAQIASPTAADIVRGAEGRIPAFLACLRDRKVALVGAHRGGPLPEYPENAIVTMERTTALVPVFIETDVQESADGVLFMNHDDVLGRNTAGTGNIADHSWAQIAALQLRDPTGQPTDYKAPLFYDLLVWAKERALIFIDMKPKTNVDRVLEQVDRAGAEGRVMYLAYTIPQAQALLQRRPNAVFALPIFNQAHFDAARVAGLLTPNLMAMVPLAKADPKLGEAIHATGATIMSGTYAGKDTPDSLFRTPADAKAYLSFVQRGAQLIVSNRPVEAAYSVFGDKAYRTKFQSCLQR